jgi:phosphotransferase system HPr-like phosphotransfer protein
MKKKRTVILSREFTVRQVVDFVRTARSFESHLYLGKNETITNGKGILGLIPLFLELRRGDSLTLIAEGADADEALAHMSLYFTTWIPDRETVQREVRDTWTNDECWNQPFPFNISCISAENSTKSLNMIK